jgi:hypothetical protein
VTGELVSTVASTATSTTGSAGWPATEVTYLSGASANTGSEITVTSEFFVTSTSASESLFNHSSSD